MFVVLIPSELNRTEPFYCKLKWLLYSGYYVSE